MSKDKIDNIPPTLGAGLLSTTDLSHWVRTSRERKKTYQPLLDERKLLTFVMRRHLLTLDSEDSIKLLKKKHRLIDSLGRFINISPIGYLFAKFDEERLFKKILPKMFGKKNKNKIEELRDNYNPLLCHVLNKSFFRRDYSSFTSDLLSKKSFGFDSLNVLFEDISPLDYMLWALNEKEFKKLLERIPKDLHQDLEAQYSTHQLLHHVVRGNHEAVRALLKENIDLLYQEDKTVIDCSGRLFKDISPWKYALWALDEHMWETMLSCIPKGEKGQAVLKHLRSQYEEVSTKGVTYTFNGISTTEQHFNFEQTIIKELQTQVDLGKKVNEDFAKNPKKAMDWKPVQKQWINGVGGAQRLLPIHVVNEYCEERAFDSDNDFTTNPGSSNEFYWPLIDGNKYWFDSNLGVKFGIEKSSSLWGCTARSKELGTRAQGDLDAMTRLYEARTKAFKKLAGKLARKPGDIKFGNLPPEIAAKFSSNREFARLANASHVARNFFQTQLDGCKLLGHVVRGEVDDVRKYLEHNIALLSNKNRVTDSSGRIFEFISPCEYMVSRLEEKQLEAMLSCIPRNKQNDELIEQLRSQYNPLFYHIVHNNQDEVVTLLAKKGNDLLLSKKSSVIDCRGRLFKDISPSEYRKALDQNQLLYHVVRGDHDMVRALLAKDISLLFNESSVIDCSGRLFRNITPWKYALWALDKHMWETMSSCIPDDEKGQAIWKKLRSQYDEVSKGVTYELDGRIITEPHFNFDETIINQLKIHVDLVNPDITEPKKYETIRDQWVQGVGGAQRLLPVHVANEYSAARTFDPDIDFSANPESSKQFLNLSPGEEAKMENWFADDSELGLTLAIVKGRYRGFAAPCSGCVLPRGDEAKFDLSTMTKLRDVRSNDFEELLGQIEAKMQAGKQSPAPR